MARRKHRPEQVINKLRQAEVAMAEGFPVAALAYRLVRKMAADRGSIMLIQ